MLEQILKKESVNEQDIKILNANLHLLSEADKLRFGFITKEEVVEAPKKVVRAPRKKA